MKWVRFQGGCHRACSIFVSLDSLDGSPEAHPKPLVKFVKLFLIFVFERFFIPRAHLCANAVGSCALRPQALKYWLK